MTHRTLRPGTLIAQGNPAWLGLHPMLWLLLAIPVLGALMASLNDRSIMPFFPMLFLVALVLFAVYLVKGMLEQL